MFLTSPTADDQLHDDADQCWNRDHRWDYRVRVRGTSYLWGAATITHNASFAIPPILHIRNDTFGEPITFGTEKAGAARTTIGILQPGEQFSVALDAISAVFATCAYESIVTCWIRHP
jgi:hypothetical protein